MGDAVMVAVRCRPFNKRETELGAKLVIKMQGAKTTISHPETGATKDFTFDYSYWSHNKNDSHFADNPKVFRDLGFTVLKNAWEGYNVCLFAYGQTGSGKSYSMVGYGDDRGIVPLAMEEMFARIAKNEDKNVKYLVEASMMEIYNEKVRDLFNPSGNPPGGLKVRDHPQTGPYVEGLSKSVVSNYKAISDLMDQGTASRTVAATQMNATSSRAHTVFQIILTTTTFDEETGKTMQRTSKVNLVDLAGSERVSKTGAAGDTLKEGIGINKSLSSLGDCIEKLAKAGGGKGEVHVPYRNSVLTWLLKQSLGGNAKTIMIAAISPADDNYDESVSTLRYADRAKQIKNKATVNEDENAKVIRQLKEEITKLREMVGKGGGGGGGGGGPAGMSDAEKEEMARLKEQLEQSAKLMKEMSMSLEEKQKQTEELARSRDKALGGDAMEKRKTVPHFVNLNKDPLLSECLSYFMPEGMKVRFCRKNAEPAPGNDDVVLAGVGFLPDHCYATNAKSKVSLVPFKDAKLFRNGQLVKEPIVLAHNDRVIMGQHLFFRYQDPREMKGDDETKSEFDFDFAQKELSQSAMAGLLEDEESKKAAEEAKRQQAEAERKAAELLATIEKEKKAAEVAQKQRQKEYEAQLADLNRKREEELRKAREDLKKAQKEDEEAMKKSLAEKEKQLEAERQRAIEMHKKQVEEQQAKQAALEARLKKQMEDNARMASQQELQSKDQRLAEETLATVIPAINEANLICKDLHQPLRFEIQVITRKTPDDLFVEETKILTRVVNTETDVEVAWDPNTLNDVVGEMRDIYHNFLETNDLAMPDKESDNPFILKPNGPQLLGSVKVPLQPLWNLVPVIEDYPIVDYKGVVQGSLSYKLIVVPSAMDKLPEKDLEFLFTEEDLGQLVGTSVDFWFKVGQATRLPTRCSHNVFFTYRWHMDPSETKSDVVKGPTSTPTFNYDRRINIGPIGDQFIDFMTKGAMFEVLVYGEAPPVVEREPLAEPEEKEWTTLAQLVIDPKEAKSDSGDGAGGSSSSSAQLEAAAAVSASNGTEVKGGAGAGESKQAAASASAAVASALKNVESKRAGKKGGKKAAAPGESLPAAVMKRVEELVQEKKQLETERAQLLAVKAEKEKLEKEKAEMAAKLEKKEKGGNNAKKVEELKKTLEDKDKAHKAELEEARRQADEARRRQEEEQAELKSLQESMKKQDHGAELVQLKQQLESAKRKIAMPAEQKDQAAQQELEAVKEQMRKRDEEMQQLRDELEKAKNRPTQNNSRSCSIL